AKHGGGGVRGNSQARCCRRSAEYARIEITKAAGAGGDTRQAAGNARLHTARAQDIRACHTGAIIRRGRQAASVAAAATADGRPATAVDETNWVTILQLEQP